VQQTQPDLALHAAVVRDTLPPTRAFRQVPQTPYSVVVGIVLGIIVLISGALYATRGSRPAAVNFSTAPADVEIRVDGKRLAQSSSPFVVQDLAPGVPHVIEVIKSGYRGWTTRLTLSSGQVLQLPLVKLVPAAGDADLLAAPAPGARDASSGARRKPKAQRASASPRVEPRRPEPRAAREARKPEPRASAASSKPTADKAATGILRLNSQPWSEVTIDGKPVGNTPLMNHVLPAGAHTIRLSNPQFGAQKTIKIQIVAGKTVTRVVDLR
jgi:hypothetical protein